MQFAHMLLKDPTSPLGETHVASLGQQTQVAEILSRHLIRSVRAERVTIEAWTRQAQASGMGEYQIETLIKMIRLRRAGPPPGGGWIGSNHYHPYSKIPSRSGKSV